MALGRRRGLPTGGCCTTSTPSRASYGTPRTPGTCRAPRTALGVRWDPLLDQSVVIASHRRPHVPAAGRRVPARPRPGTAGRPRSRPTTTRSWSSRTGFPPSPPPRCSGPDPDDLADSADHTDPLFTRRAGVGRCEVVCFTSDHSAAFASLPPDRVDTVFDAWVDRTRDLNAMPEVEQVFVFENRGEEIGVTLSHPHGQIYAYPFVPPRMRRRPIRPAGTGSVRPSACTASCSPPSAAPAPGSSPRTTWSPSSSRTPPGGRTRRTSTRAGTSRTCRRSPTRSVPRWPGPTWTCCGGSTACSRRRRRTSRPSDAGAGPERPRADAPARRGVLDPPRRRQAQVHRRQRVRGRGMDQRRRPGGRGRGAAARPARRPTGRPAEADRPCRGGADSEVHVAGARQVAGRRARPSPACPPPRPPW